MKNKFLFLPLMGYLFLSFCVSSCKKATFLKVDNNKVSTTIDGTSGNINIETDGKEVEVVHSPRWIKTSINEENTILNYTIELNTDRKLREDSIVLKSSDLTCAVYVKQTFKATYIKFDNDTVRFGRKGGTEQVSVEVDAASPLHVDNMNIAKVDGRKIIITMPETWERTGVTKVIKVSCDDITANLIVLQETKKCKRCGGSGFLNKPCSNCGGLGAHMCCMWTGKEMCPSCYGTGIE